MTSVTASVVARRELIQRLETGGGVTVVSAPAGSGKTVLLRSWIEEAGLQDAAAWVSLTPDEQDAQQFWLAIIEALSRVPVAATVVGRVQPAPDFDPGAAVARLSAELASLAGPAVLVVDDLQELQANDALAQLEAFLAHRPDRLRVVLSTRRDLPLGLHRLRLAGEVTELRGADLRFSLDETRALFAETGVAVADESVARLRERTEGWAAGLRLAALALAGHPDPERFVQEFSGSERTVADYLVAEVLERQPEDARRLLLRTSILERVIIPLADLLSGRTGSQRILRKLEDDNAFVVSLDASRSVFRYHRLFADLLRLELDLAEPGAASVLHRVAADWYEQHREVVEAVRHAQAAGDWGHAARILADHSFSLALDGRGETVRRLVLAFPEGIADEDPELARVFATGAIWGGSIGAAASYIAAAERNAELVADDRRPQFDLLLHAARLGLARRRGDVEAVLVEAERLLEGDAVLRGLPGHDDDLRASTLLNLGTVELWAARDSEAVRHLERGLELSRLARRPWLEAQCLAYLALAATPHSLSLARERGLEAVGIVESRRWGDRAVAAALVAVGNADALQGRFDDAEQWLQRASEAVRADLDPMTAVFLHVAQGRLDLARGRDDAASRAFLAAVELEERLVGPQTLTVLARRLLTAARWRIGQEDPAPVLRRPSGEDDRFVDVGRTLSAHAYLAHGDPVAAVAELEPVLAGASPTILLVEALLLDARARDELGDMMAARADVERALELAEPDALAWPFVFVGVRDLLERHPRHGTAHGALLQHILDVFVGFASARVETTAAPREHLTDAELRVLRYLPTNLTAPDIGRELYLSLSTVKTHMQHIYAKLGVHRRAEAVERARELGLLGPSPRTR